MDLDNFAPKDVPDVKDLTEPETLTELADTPEAVQKNYIELRAKAYDLFMMDNKTVAEVAIEVGVPARKIVAWAKRGGWIERKKQIEQELMARVDAEYREVILQHRIPTLKRHLEVGGMLESKIGEAIGTVKVVGEDGKMVPFADSTLKRLSEALSSATGVTARAAGITDKPFSSEEDARKVAPVIIIGAGAAPIRVIEGSSRRSDSTTSLDTEPHQSDLPDEPEEELSPSVPASGRSASPPVPPSSEDANPSAAE